MIDLAQTPIPKEQAEADISLFAEYITRIKPDRNCRVSGCFGRGYLGFQVVPSKDGPKTQLLLCKCARIGETEYTKLYSAVDSGLGFLHKQIQQEAESIRRRSFFGAFEYLWGKAREKWANNVDGIIKGRLKNNGFCITKYISSNYPEWFKPLRKP